MRQRASAWRYGPACATGDPAGFWPGNDAFPRAAFFSYAYPGPPGFRDRPVPPGAYFDTNLGKFILPYDAVRTGGEPDALPLKFLSSTYEAAADTEGWDRAALECELGVPGRVRSVMNHELHMPRTLTRTCVHCWLCYETRWSISVVENLWTRGRTGGSGIGASHFASSGAA